ncbi:MurR/RpiR family transcriptional regulator [Candidatus Enterococcus leclercqii]|uniref:MurR/RpiR family transcriptional regulator n=1 Tax=Candidatus Enterococcus leclercqii TaxID=1857218 RepID=UPI001379B66E|nr:MurR/RpiR family transcriptional regulator [Enterococcus sp. CU9D]KAF1293056.1 RpiR family transcriptional regulator [Enterococcus sp. CU9D]
MELLPMISSYFPSLSKSEKKVAQSILANPDEVQKMSLNEFSMMAGVGESTIVRFARKVGFGGYQDLKFELAKSLATAEKDQNLVEDNDFDKVFNQYQQSLLDTRNLIEAGSVGKAAELIHGASRVVLFAVGNSGIIAEQLANRLKRLGKFVEFVRDGHLQSINSAFMTAADVALAVSTSGNTTEVITNIELAQKHGSKVVAITNFLGSKVATLSDVALIASSKEYQSDAGSFAAAVNQLYLIDILMRAVVELDPEYYHQYRLMTNEVLMKRIQEM